MAIHEYEVSVFIGKPVDSFSGPRLLREARSLLSMRKNNQLSQGGYFIRKGDALEAAAEETAASVETVDDFEKRTVRKIGIVRRIR